MNKNKLSKIVALTGLTILISPLRTVAQIIPATDGTGTIVKPSSPAPNSQTRFDIQGGNRSADRANLFHSFEQFNLNYGETVNFISTPETRNILTRVRGGNLSQINGVIQVTGSNANLFLMNPAGIIFGQNASLNVPASFFATTSTAISLGESLNGIPSWFHGFTTNNYSELIGSPRGFVFSETSGKIINQANLKVAQGKTIGLMGSHVINVGELDAPNGNVNIETVPGKGLVRISQVGNLLNLEVPTQRILENPNLSITALPKFLTGGTQEHATMVQVRENGTIKLTNSSNFNPFQDQGRSAFKSFGSYHNDRRVSFVPPFPPPETFPIQLFTVLKNSNLFSQIPSFSLNRANISETGFSLPIPPLPPIAITDRSQFQRSTTSPFSSASFSSIPSFPFATSSIPEIPPFSVEFFNNPEMRFSTTLFAGLQERIAIAEAYPNSIKNYPVLRSRPSDYLTSPNYAQLPTEKILTETSIREMLSQIEAQTSQKPAVIYAITHQEQMMEQIKGVQLKAQSGLTLMLVLPNGQTIVKILDVEQNKLRQLAKEFYVEVSDPRTTGWPAARQLYNWLITPLKSDLKKAGIDTLLFYLDEELRSIPLAALYDGQQFLIETYNFSLIPSLSLTNVSYEKLQNSQVLAMGMSEFVDRPTLPNVPTEILTITNKLWPGEALLNQAFTLENLQKKLDQQAFKIIHMATHANFTSQHKAYIQFWDRKLPLKQLRDLEWHRQPQVELLVLSACETGLGNTQETEMGFAGLAHQAGVKSALASLWQVSDVGTLSLMIEFYSNLKSSSIKAEALRQAQLALLRGEVKVEANLLHSTRGNASVSNTLALSLETKDLSHPYYWASFTMIGSPW